MKRSARILLLAVAVTLCFQAAAAQDEDVVTVDSSLVVMNASVSDSAGRAVSGIKQAEFSVFEDGTKQEIAFFEAANTPFAAVILLDTSGSMQERISLARSAAINFLDGLRAEDSASIYNFDSKVKLVQDFSNSRDITESVFDLKAYGMTAMNDAIVEAAKVLAQRPEKRRAIVVLSDGEDTQSKFSASRALKEAMAANATIYTVDMSSIDTGGKQRMQNQGVLRNFAEKSGGRFVKASGGLALRDAFKGIVEELGTQYTIAYEPTNGKKDGKWRALELRIARPGLRIRTRQGYHAPKAK